MKLFKLVRRDLLAILILGFLLLIAAGLHKLQAKTFHIYEPAYPSADRVSFERYFNEKISGLSPVKEVLGGKFYVTKVETDGGAGTVYYEDGHNAYVADFTYTLSEHGISSIDTFTLRK